MAYAAWLSDYLDRNPVDPPAARRESPSTTASVDSGAPRVAVPAKHAELAPGRHAKAEDAK